MNYELSNTIKTVVDKAKKEYSYLDYKWLYEQALDCVVRYNENDYDEPFSEDWLYKDLDDDINYYVFNRQ